MSGQCVLNLMQSDYWIEAGSALVAFASPSQAQAPARRSKNRPGLQSADPTPPLVKEILILLFVFARKLSPPGQPDLVQVKWKL